MAIQPHGSVRGNARSKKGCCACLAGFFQERDICAEQRSLLAFETGQGGCLFGVFTFQRSHPPHHPTTPHSLTHHPTHSHPTHSHPTHPTHPTTHPPHHPPTPHTAHPTHSSKRPKQYHHTSRMLKQIQTRLLSDWLPHHRQNRRARPRKKKNGNRPRRAAARPTPGFRPPRATAALGGGNRQRQRHLGRTHDPICIGFLGTSVSTIVVIQVLPNRRLHILRSGKACACQSRNH